MSASEKSPIDRIRAIVRRDPSYRVEAYCFVFEALDHTLRSLTRPRHVTGQELCLGIRDLAVERFGLLARMVLLHWGVTRTHDFGRIVFNLIDEQLMGKTDTDSIDDFAGVYEFDDAFDRGLTIGARLWDVYGARGALELAREARVG